MGHVLLKSSLGEVLDKPCVSSSGHIFSSIIMKPGQNFCLYKISDEFENGSCRLMIGHLVKC